MARRWDVRRALELAEVGLALGPKAETKRAAEVRDGGQ